MRYLKIILVFLSIHSFAFAQIRVPAFFSDDMVLQQNQLVNLWGTDKPNTAISVKGSWGKDAKTITNENGNWKLKLQTPAAGGPYTVIIKGTTELVLKNVLMGEVWLCAGQSNMEMPVKGYLNQPVIGSNETILNSTNDKIRFFNTPRSVSITPLSDVKGNWKTASPSTTGSFSATAYYFAKKLQSVLGVPIGIIQTAWGASSVESWMDKESLSAFKNKIIPITVPDSLPNKTPTILYNTMLHPYIGYTIKGMLWYQGEANRENANEYQALFTSMIQSWRKQWQQGDFPFYFVQIAPFEGGKVNAAFLREAQLKTMLTVPNTGMVVTLDTGERTVIHPAQKETVGNRLAYWALANAYEVKEIACSGPVFKTLKINEAGKAILQFDFCDQGLTSFGKPLTGFEVAGEDRVFYSAEAIINNDKKGLVTVWSEQVKKPVSIRYAFKSWAEASLFNTQGLPASSFRTDDW
jgi:sialate O-acetylesterase